MTEAELLRAILDALRRVFPRWTWARNNTGRRGRVTFGLGTGSPDIIGCVGGRLCCLEVKLPDGRWSLEQKLWASLWSKAGAHYEVVRSVADAIAAVKRCEERSNG